MATETLRPNSDVSVGCSYVGNSTRAYNVDEEVASDADYNYYKGTGTAQDTLGLADSGIGAGVISNVSLRTRLWVDDGGDNFLERVRPKLVVGGTSYYGTPRGPGVWPPAEFTDDWANNPAGGAWTWAAINALECGYEIRGDTQWTEEETFLKGGYVSQQYIIITYTLVVRSRGHVIG